MQLLESVASKLGRFNLEWYGSLAKSPNSVFIVDLRYWTPRLLASITNGPVHPALILCQLAEPELSFDQRRRAGSYYTDFRLANHLGSRVKTKIRPGKPPLILDAASGSGVLLVATVLALSRGQSAACDLLIRHSVHAADLSATALRGAALSLASLAHGSQSVSGLFSRLRQGDSLLKGAAWWRDLAPDGFDLVVGNPPWEKLKVSRHEHLRSNGVERHYGTDYTNRKGLESLALARQSSAAYQATLSDDYALQGCGDPDLYKLFLELMLRLLRPGGELSAYVPAGLIRSLGCKPLRELLNSRAESLNYCVFENRARFFAIDTRFKFLGVRVQTKRDNVPSQGTPILLSHATGTDTAVNEGTTVCIDHKFLGAIRADLSIPEVKTDREWQIFQEVTRRGVRIGDLKGMWKPELLREVDMTNDREVFLDHQVPGALPLIEGRMVHQFSHTAKHYVSGRGRSAIWSPARSGQPRQIKPQFWYPEAALNSGTRKRVWTPRLGFCDITGQTNERTMLAARIPSGAVCGNKVPTILFPGATNPGEQTDVGAIWLTVLNSFTFDWMLRRVVTTTVNYFLLLDLPFPDKLLTKDTAAQKRLEEISILLSSEGKCLTTACTRGGWEIAELRAEADWRVLDAYGQPVEMLETILEDFPLLDRSQPPLPGEERSTITKDFVLLRAAQSLGTVSSERAKFWEGRVQHAKSCGAVPFVSSHLDVGE